MGRGIWLSDQKIDPCLEDEPLFTGPVGRHPEPAIAEIVVYKEDVAGLEGDLVRVGHLGVGQDGHHPLLIVNGLGRRHGEGESLMLEQVRYVGVVP